jgi:steroid delta-isomerase-like uncharacterized protein
MKTYRWFIIAALVLVILAGCQSGQGAPTASPGQADVSGQNLAVVRQVYDAIAAGDVVTFASLHTNPFTLNYPGGSEEVDPQLMGEDLAAIRNANPDLHAEIQDIYASGDLVITQLTWRATHTGDLFGIPATGNQLVHNGVVVRRLQDGKIVESWETFDDFEFLHNLGFLPAWEEVVAPGFASATAPETVVATPTLAPNQVMATTIDQLIGIWRGRAGSPGDPPQTYWWFRDDGTYRVAFEIAQFNEGYSIEAGAYAFEGASLVLVAGKGGCADPASNTGTYEAKLTSNADGTPSQLTFTILNDSCDPRKTGLSGLLPYVQAQP